MPCVVWLKASRRAPAILGPGSRWKAKLACQPLSRRLWRKVCKPDGTGGKKQALERLRPQQLFRPQALAPVSQHDGREKNAAYTLLLDVVACEAVGLAENISAKTTQVYQIGGILFLPMDDIWMVY